MTTARIPLLHRYANPAAFGRLAAQILPWTVGASAILLGLGLYFALFASPPDYQQGESVRIMYVHVPAAIMSEVVYGMMAAAAAAGIIWKHALADAFDDPQRGLRAGAILVLVGVVDLPIIKFSVDWWNTLHQPASLMTLSGPKVDPSMLLPLMLMIGGFTTFFITVALMRLESELLARRIRAWRTAAGEE